MKRLLHIQFLLVLLLALGCSPLQAKRITQWQAQQQAYSFWGKQMPQKAKAKSRTATTASTSDAYYVFNNDAGGFVIIAGDDAVTPVLGYTSTGSFDAENLPDGLKDLLKSYERQIAALGDSYQANQTATRAAFTGEKLLNTAKWNQMAPFNKYTPNNYVTGCVATAGAIVMKHHGYPAKGTGSHSYTWNGKTLTANFELGYDWANMPAQYNGNDAAFDGVARLMADLGVAVEMQYNKDGSGAYIGNLVTALQKYYGYSKLSHLMAIEDVGAEAWNGRLRDEIDANRPVLYAASDPNTGGGHAFVIDGYKDESFSVNWGWGGYCDGFYKIGALNPESEGNPTGDKYNVGQSAVFGMEPSDGTEKISSLGFRKVTGLLQSMNMNITDVKKGQNGVIFSVPIGNTGDHPYTGEVAVALMNAKGEKREIVTSRPLTVVNLAAGAYYPSLSFSFESTVDAEPGDYLAIVAKENGSSEYIELYDQNFERLRLPATGYEPRTFEVKTKMGEGATFQQAETRYNPARNFYNGKPVIGSWYYYYLTVDEGISKYFAELNGKLMDDVELGTAKPNSFIGIEPVYELVVSTYRNYQEKELVINLEKAGQLKEKLAKENPDYFVYRNIKVNGVIDKRDFDELASHYFKSIDLSGAKVVAYESYKADMVPKYAFYGNTYLEQFQMPSGVRELGFNAFRATNLKEIDLPETIEEFGRNTFFACFELKDVYMRHKEAPYWISWCVFANKSSKLYRTLHLYPGSKAKYDAHQYTKNWIKYFDNVVEDLEPTGIHSVTLDKKPGNKAIYDLNGRRIQNVPSRGIYIQNGKKISVK